MERFVQDHSAEELREILVRYAQIYDFCYGEETEGMSTDERAALYDLYLEEYFADAAGGINRARMGSRGASRDTSATREVIAEREGMGNGSGGMPGARYMFARESDSAVTDQAEALERDGADRDEIWRELGIIRDASGIWVTELDDSQMQVFPKGDALLAEDPQYRRYMELARNGDFWAPDYAGLQERYGNRDQGKKTLDMFVRHDALFERYPQLRNTEFLFRDLPAGEHGYFTEGFNAIVLDSGLKKEINAGQLSGTAIHEIQHAVQAIDKRAGGASVAYWRNQGQTEEQARESYRNTAGELEANEAQRRRGMNAEERRANTPDLGWDRAVFAEDADEAFLAKKREKDTIKMQIQRHLDEINSMEPVTHVKSKGRNGRSDARVLEDLIEKFKRWGYRVDKQGFGIINFEGKLLDQSLNYLGKKENAAELAAFEALPYVLKRGMILPDDKGLHDDHKDRRYPSFTIAAPIVLNDKPAIMAAVVIRTKGNRYRTHRVLTPDGNVFNLMETINDAESSTPGEDSRFRAPSQPSNGSASINSIDDSAPNSNTELGLRSNIPGLTRWDREAEAQAERAPVSQDSEETVNRGRYSIAEEDVGEVGEIEPAERRRTMTEAQINSMDARELRRAVAEDEIKISKDGETVKATYYQHIYTLFSLFRLDDRQSYAMRCMSMMPLSGIPARLFAKWTGFTDMNTVNDLTELGFIREDESRELSLHPMMQDVTVADLKPSVTNCQRMLGKIGVFCNTYDRDVPYARLIRQIVENTIRYMVKEDINWYVRFLEHVQASLPDSSCEPTPNAILDELEHLLSDETVGTAEDRAALLHFKALRQKSLERSIALLSEAVRIISRR